MLVSILSRSLIHYLIPNIMYFIFTIISTSQPTHIHTYAYKQTCTAVRAVFSKLVRTSCRHTFTPYIYYCFSPFAAVNISTFNRIPRARERTYQKKTHNKTTLVVSFLFRLQITQLAQYFFLCFIKYALEMSTIFANCALVHCDYSVFVYNFSWFIFYCR